MSNYMSVVCKAVNTDIYCIPESGLPLLYILFRLLSTLFVAMINDICTIAVLIFVVMAYDNCIVGGSLVSQRQMYQK